MPERPLKEFYSRKDAERLLGISERKLRGWEKQELVPRLDQYALPDLIALKSLKKLQEGRVSTVRIRQAVRALREKLEGVANPLRDLKIVCEGRRVVVLLDGRKVEPVSGQLLLDFDRAELKTLLAFPCDRPAGGARARQAEAWFEKGLEMEQTGAPLPEVVAAYETALELDPQSTGALVNLGTVCYHTRAWERAERCYLRALEVDPTYALAHFNLGNLYDEQGRSSEALDQYKAALGINPNYADAHYNLALLYQTRGEPLQAIRQWKIYLKLDGGSSWAAIARRELEKLATAMVFGKRQNGG